MASGNFSYISNLYFPDISERKQLWETRKKFIWTLNPYIKNSELALNDNYELGKVSSPFEPKSKIEQTFW